MKSSRPQVLGEGIEAINAQLEGLMGPEGRWIDTGTLLEVEVIGAIPAYLGDITPMQIVFRFPKGTTPQIDDIRLWVGAEAGWTGMIRTEERLVEPYADSLTLTLPGTGLPPFVKLTFRIEDTQPKD